MENSTLLVNTSNVVDPRGNRLPWQSWRLSADQEFVLFSTNYVKQWRHSSHANYFIHRLSDSTTFPLVTPMMPPTIAFVAWSPTGHSLAYVMANDLYVIPGYALSETVEPIRVTDDGSDVTFNGVPDWVYEEEVFGTDFAMWWSPDSSAIAYLRSDEATVKDYKLQYYDPSNDAFKPYQYLTELDMK